MTESEQAIDQFVDTARQFCAWLEGEPYDDATERFTALCLLSRLYSAALHLPEIPSERLTLDHDPSKGDDELTRKVMNRLDRFPTRKYWRIKTTADASGENVEKVEDDMAGDLFFTYTGVKGSLLMLERGGDRCRDLAVWSWRFSFWLDWGRHSSNTIQALHAQFHEEANREDE